MSKWNKGQLQNWFRTYYPEEFNPKDTKDVLWQKAKKIKEENPQFVVDDMVKDAGMILLRTPPYHCEINPIGNIFILLYIFMHYGREEFVENPCQYL